MVISNYKKELKKKKKTAEVAAIGPVLSEIVSLRRPVSKWEQMSVYGKAEHTQPVLKITKGEIKNKKF